MPGIAGTTVTNDSPLSNGGDVCMWHCEGGSEPTHGTSGKIDDR